MTLYATLAEKLQYISPKFYKKRYFKKLIGLSPSNIMSRGIEPELLWIQSALKPTDVFMDIGANVGVYLYALEGNIPSSQLYGFEPSKRLCARLRRLFPGAHIFPIAFSDENKMGTLKIPKVDGKSLKSRATLRSSYKEEGESGASYEKVKVMRLDDWAKIEEIHSLSFIKIDVEGNELKVIEGAKKTLARLRPKLMIEIEQRHHETPVWNIIEEVLKLGYRAYYLNRETLELSPLSPELMEKQNANHLKEYSQYINNIIFVPEK